MSKKVKKVYIETSVISGYGRIRFHDTLMEFFELIRKGLFIPIISAHTVGEVYDEKTPVEVIKNFESIEYSAYDTTIEMSRLLDKYMLQKIIDEKYVDDALHIAIATVLNVDVLVSWNLTHIVNEMTIPLFNKVNNKNGYSSIVIQKPEEIM